MGLQNLINPFVTPNNIRSGVDFLQNNQGIVNTLTGLPIGPASARSYIRNLSGSQEPITEDFFNSSQLGEIRNRTASGMADRSMKYNTPLTKNMDGKFKLPFKMRNNVIGYNLNNPISMSGIFSNPVTDIDATLGKFTYNQNQDGTVSAIDKHDFDSIQGGENKFYGNKEKFVGDAERLGYRDLPFLEPNTVDADPGQFMGLGADDQGFDLVAPAGPANMYQPYFPGGESMGPLAGKFLEGNPEYQVTKQEEIYEGPDSVLNNVVNAYKKGDISASKLSRFVGGMFGQVGTNELNDQYGNPKTFYSTTGNEGLRSNWNTSSIPVNVNLGEITHEDKMRNNKRFANYIHRSRNIPSEIRKDARPFSDSQGTNSPDYSSYRTVSGGYTGSGNFDTVDNSGKDYGPHSNNTQTGFGKSGMGRDPDDRMANGGRISFKNGGLASILYG